MMKVLVAIILLLITPHSALAGYDLGISGATVSTADLVRMCNGNAEEQAFCHGFLSGIYENSTCMEPPRETHSFIDLKEAFIVWAKFKGDKGYAFASMTAAAAIYEKYGCVGYLK